MAIAPEVLEDHYRRFFPSLYQYPERYLHMFFQDSQNPPQHLAYVCPLCTENGFVSIKEIALAERGVFTKDHYPPENVGGKNFLLVCATCNNRAGGRYENELVKQMATRSYNNRVPGAKLTVKSMVSQIPGNYNSLISIGSEGRFEISLNPKSKSKGSPLNTWLERSEKDNNWGANITVFDPNEAKVTRALLKAAYLYCFNVWRYEFVYSYTAGMMRKVLKEELVYPLINPSFWLTDRLKGVTLTPGVYKMVHPAEWRKFIVIMELTDLNTGYQDTVGVIIPGPDEKEWEDLTRIQEILNSSPELIVTFVPVNTNEGD